MKLDYLEIKTLDKPTLRGVVHHSKDDNPKPVIICHGYFSACRNGPQRLYVETANYLTKRGFEVYRFDLSGMGESDGEIDNTVFDDHVDDLGRIIEFVRSRHPEQKICLIAHCLGCNYALANILKKDDIYREIILMAPFYTNERVLNGFFGEESLVDQLHEYGFTKRKGLYAHRSFFEKNDEKAVIERINSVKVTVNVIIPRQDQFIPLEDNQRIFGKAKFANVIEMNGDHNFLETKLELISKIGDLLTDDKYTI